VLSAARSVELAVEGVDAPDEGPEAVVVSDIVGVGGWGWGGRGGGWAVDAPVERDGDGCAKLKAMRVGKWMQDETDGWGS
jgi:hypothetical protein